MAANNKMVHVIQGHSANLMCNSILFGISGLYTDDFSPCIILICATKTQCTLYHLDIEAVYNKDTCQQIIDSINMIEGCKKINIYYKTDGIELKNNMLKYLKSLNISDVENIYIENNIEGIGINFTDSKYVISYYLFSQTELIRHPQEEIIITLRKIKQIIGYGINRSYSSKLCIFNNIGWCKMNDEDLNILYDEMKLRIITFNNDYDLCIIGGRLKDMVISFGQHLSDESYRNVAKYMMIYLCNYEQKKIFQNGLQCLKNIKSSHNDIILKKDISKIKNININDGIIKLNDILRNLRPYSSTELTEYQNNIRSILYVIIQIYDSSEIYKNVKNINIHIQPKINKFLIDGNALFELNNYNDAKNLFHRAIELMILCTYIDDEQWLLTFISYIKCYNNLDYNKEMYDYINNCIQMLKFIYPTNQLVLTLELEFKSYHTLIDFPRI